LAGKSLEEVERLLDEIDTQASFFIIAAAEAGILVDFYKRVTVKGRKDPVTRAFRNIYNVPGKRRVHLQDVLDTWAAEVPTAKADIHTFKGALSFRHWLAHGRYWVPKFGRTYDPTSLIRIVARLFQRIGVANN